MSGIVIDVRTGAPKATEDVKELSKELKSVGRVQIKNKIVLPRFNDFNRQLGGVNKQLAGLSSNMIGVGRRGSAVANDTSNAFGNLGNVVKRVVVGMLALKGLSLSGRLADDLQSVNNRIAIMSKGLDEVVAKQRRLYQVSKETRSSLAGTTNLAVDFTRSLGDIGYAERDILKVVGTINKAGALSGQSVQSVNAALFQLSQGIAANRLSGQEYNAVAEQMGYILLPLARAMGKSIGELRKFANEGGITAKAFVDGILKASSEIDEDFARTGYTLSQAVARFRNAVSYFIGDFVLFTGSAQKMANRLVKMGDFVDTLNDNFVSKIALLRMKFLVYIRQLHWSSAIKTTISLAVDYKVNFKQFLKIYGVAQRIKKAVDLFYGVVNPEPIKFKNTKQIEEYLGLIDKMDTRLRASGRPGIPTNIRGNMLGVLAKQFEFSETKAELMRGFSIFWTNVKHALEVRFITPQTSFMGEQVRSLKTRTVSILAKALSFSLPTMRKMEGVQEAALANLSRDNRIARAFVAMFQSTNIRDFREKLAVFNDLRATGHRRDDIMFRAAEGMRKFRGQYVAAMREAQSFGLRKQTLIWFDLDPAITRIRHNLETWRRIFRIIYTDILVPKFGPAVYDAFQKSKLVWEAWTEAAKNTFNYDTGFSIGYRFGQAIADGFSKLSTWLQKNVANAKNTEQLLKMLRGLTTHVGGFFVGFARGMARAFRETDLAEQLIQAFKTLGTTLRKALVESMPTGKAAREWFGRFVEGFRELSPIDFLLNLGTRLRESLLKLGSVIVEAAKREFTIDIAIPERMRSMFGRIAEVARNGAAVVVEVITKFAQKIKDIFFDVYDEVVGHSTWPDLIDGIISHAKRLNAALPSVKSFTDSVKGLFVEMLDLLGETKFGKPIKRFADLLMAMDWNYVAKRIGVNFGATMLGAIVFVFGGTIARLALINVIFSSLQKALTPAAADIAQELGASLGMIMGRVGDAARASLINTWSLLTQSLGSLIKGFLGETFSGVITNVATMLAPLGAVVLKAFNLDKAVSAVSLFFAGYALLAKNGFAKVNKAMFEGSKTSMPWAEILTGVAFGSSGKAAASQIPFFIDTNALKPVWVAAFAAASGTLSKTAAAVFSLPFILESILGPEAFRKATARIGLRSSVKYLINNFLDAFKSAKGAPKGAIARFFSGMLLPIAKGFKPALDKLRAGKIDLSQFIDEAGFSKSVQIFRRRISKLFLDLEVWAMFNNKKLSGRILNFAFDFDPNGLTDAFKRIKLALKTGFTSILAFINNYKKSFALISLGLFAGLTFAGENRTLVGEYRELAFNSSVGFLEIAAGVAAATYALTYFWKYYKLVMKFKADGDSGPLAMARAIVPAFGAAARQIRDFFMALPNAIGSVARWIKNTLSVEAFMQRGAKGVSPWHVLNLLLGNILLTVVSLGKAFLTLSNITRKGAIADMFLGLLGTVVFSVGLVASPFAYLFVLIAKLADSATIAGTALNYFGRIGVAAVVAVSKAIGKAIASLFFLTSAVFQAIVPIRALRALLSAPLGRGILDFFKVYFKSIGTAIARSWEFAKGVGSAFTEIGARIEAARVDRTAFKAAAAMKRAAADLARANSRIGKVGFGEGLLKFLKSLGKFSLSTLKGVSKAILGAVGALVGATGPAAPWVGGLMAVGGVLSVMYFGKGNGFIDKLQYTYDKLKEIFGLSKEGPTTAGGRQGKLWETLPQMLIGKEMFDPLGKVPNLDFKAMSQIQAKVLLDAAETYRKGLNDIQVQAIEKGELTPGLRTQMDKLARDFQTILTRLPTTAENTLENRGAKTASDLLHVDTSWAVQVRRYLGIPLGNEPLQQKPRWVLKNEELEENKARLLGLRRMRLEFPDVYENLQLKPPESGFWKLPIIKEVSDWVSTAFKQFESFGIIGKTIAVTITAISASFLVIAAGVAAIPSAILAATGAVVGFFGGVGFVEWIKEILYSKPSPEPYQEEMARKARARVDELKPYEKFITGQIREDRDKLDTELARLVVERQTLLQRGRGGSGYKPWDPAYDARMAEIDKRIPQLEEAIGVVHRTALAIGKQRKGKSDLDALLSGLSSDFSTFLKLEFGDNGSKFFGTSSDLKKLQSLRFQAHTPYYMSSEGTTTEERRSNALKLDAIRRQAETAFERANAFSVPLDIKLKTDKLGIDAAKLNEALQLDPKLLRDLDSYLDATEQIDRVLDGLDSKTADPKFVASLLRAKDEIKEFATKRVEVPVTAKLTSLNEVVSQIKGEEISLESLGLLPADKIRETVGSLQVAKTALTDFGNMKPDPNNLEPYITKAQKLAEVLAKARAQLAGLKVSTFESINEKYADPLDRAVAAEASGLLSVPTEVYKKGNAAVTHYYGVSVKLAEATAAVAKATADGAGIGDATQRYISSRIEADKLTKSLERMAEAIDITLSSAFGALSDYISTDLISVLGPETQHFFAGIGSAIQVIQAKLDKLKPSAAGTAEYIGLIAQRTALEFKAASEAIKHFNTNTVVDAFGEDSLRMSNKEMAKFLALRGKEMLQSIRNKRLTGSAAIDAAKEEARAKSRREADEARASRTFNDRLSVVNDTLSLSLSELDFAAMGDKLYAIADGFKARLDEASRTGADPSQILAEIDFTRFKTKFINVLIEARNAFRDALSDGVYTTFEKFKESVPDISIMSYVNIAPEARAALQRQGAELDAFRKMLDMPNMPQGLADILNGPGSISEKVKQVFDKFGDVIPAEPLDKNTTALQRLTSVLENIFGEGSAVPAVPEKKPLLAAAGIPDVAQGVRDLERATAFQDVTNRMALISSQPDEINRIRAMAPGLTPRQSRWAVDAGVSGHLGSLYNDFGAAQLLGENEQAQEIQERIDQFVADIQRGGDAVANGINQIREDIVSGLSNALTGLFKGERSEGMSVFETFAFNLLDAISSSIITNVVKGFTDVLTAPLNEMMSQLGEGLMKSVMGENGEQGIFGQIFSGILGWFGGLFSGAPGKADGGRVSGPGTGTSDSILTRLSNGEFVVRAKQTRKYLPLLQAINSGNVPQFATGGLVGPNFMQQPNLAAAGELGTTSVSNMQEININITGDISRQTRSEIYGMLPQIAAGVNAHNHEQNYKR